MKITYESDEASAFSTENSSENAAGSAGASEFDAPVKGVAVKATSAASKTPLIILLPLPWV